MTSQKNETTEESWPHMPPNLYEKPVTTPDGSWRLEVTTLYMAEHLRIVKIDTKTGEMKEAAYLYRDQVHELRDLLVEAFAPPKDCLECPLDIQNKNRPETKMTDNKDGAGNPQH